MRLHRGWGRVQASAILLAFVALAGAGPVRAEQTPLGSEPRGVVVEMGPAEPPTPAGPAPSAAPLVPAPPGGAPASTMSALAGEIRSLRERVEALERTLTGLLDALPIVASGVMAVPPSARRLEDPVANPLGFARLQPGQATVRHGLGAAEVTVHLAVAGDRVQRFAPQEPEHQLRLPLGAPPFGQLPRTRWPGRVLRWRPLRSPCSHSRPLWLPSL